MAPAVPTHRVGLTPPKIFETLGGTALRRQDLLQREASIWPEVLEPGWRQFGVANRMPNILMTEIALD